MEPSAIIYAENQENKTPGFRLDYFYLHGVAEERAGYDCVHANIETLRTCLREGISLVKIIFPDSTSEIGIMYSTFKQGRMKGLICFANDIDAINYIFSKIKEWPSIYGHEKQFLIDNHIDTCKAIRGIIDENNMSLADKLKRYYETEEGKASIKEFQRKAKLREEYKERWEEKFTQKLLSLSDDELESLMRRFCEWEEKYHDMWYKRGVDTSSRIMGALINSTKALGENIDSDEDFFSGGHTYRGYTFKTFCGQGCFTSITKGEERLY
jgi:hypothetical protein